jgi:hypothetical protein
VVSSISNFRPPFVGPAGTRSSTQALVDPIRRNTITASSLTYAADGSASFNGSTDFITIPNTTLGNGDLPWTYLHGLRRLLTHPHWERGPYYRIKVVVLCTQLCVLIAAK